MNTKSKFELIQNTKKKRIELLKQQIDDESYDKLLSSVDKCLLDESNKGNCQAKYKCDTELAALVVHDYLIDTYDFEKCRIKNNGYTLEINWDSHTSIVDFFKA